ncbi:hypothetical protein [Actinoplanes siamensis]|uniref:Uncharacterized protein n=1 Tax=Actinoplanes siamensis TaxID=1223317 RepID=A0A919NFK8_9ACTN|nr:hypothetical protein [Actinoplanes siamensis]GIF09794.1 hypothetical protein Asi03nite_73320 [Actinoplanes siamensis]
MKIKPNGRTGTRVGRAVLAAVVASMCVLAATGSQAFAAVTEFRHHDSVIYGRLADFKITFYGDPYKQSQKHLIVADKQSDGKVATIRVWPSPIASPCSYIDYSDKGGADDGAYHYDIYYPVGMITYRVGGDTANWGGTYGYDVPGIIDNC